MGGRSRLGRRVAALPDIVVRWVRMPRPGAPLRRRFVVVQIDGLSHTTLQRALERRYMPATARLLRNGQLRLFRLAVGLPTSTPAFQAGLMYGGDVDIPAFEFLDKATGDYLWFPRPWASARVEETHARDRRGIMEGGRTYGCIFGGGAADTVLTLSQLLRPSPLWGRFGVRARIVPLLLLGGVTAKLLVVTGVQVLIWLGGALRDFSLGHAIVSPKRLLIRLLISGGLRELFTLGITADIYAGVPALYVNFVDYDVPAHAVGPEHRRALRSLRYVDASIGDIARAVRRVPELSYDLYVLSDHGMTASVPFEALSGGVPAAEAVLAAFGAGPAASAAHPASAGAERGVASTLRPFAPIWQRHLAYLEPPVRERRAVWARGLCVVPAGSNVNIYLIDTPKHVLAEEIERRYPGALLRLSLHPGVGFLLARAAEGPVCYYRGRVLHIPPSSGLTGCPLFDRPDRALVTTGLRDLLDMPSAGDVIVYGNYTTRGCVSYLGERGSHAGPSEEELYAFVMAVPGVSFDFEDVRRPRELYALFCGYHAGDRTSEERGT